MEYEHFYPELGTHFPGYPWMSFNRALNISARTLCRLGLTWRVELSPINCVPGKSEYALVAPYDSYIVQLLDANGMSPTTPMQLDHIASRWRERTGRPTHYYPLPDNAIRVYPVPTEAGQGPVYLRAAVAPTPEATELDDAYALAHERLLLHGAMANLGRGNWAEFEEACHRVRSHSTDERQIGVARAVRYGGV